MTLAEIIGALADAGYSQTELAEACGCAQSTISDIANGKNNDPRGSINEKLKALYAARKPAKQKARV
jgi:transcriptional regulator with XRE-family HTH domain